MNSLLGRQPRPESRANSPLKDSVQVPSVSHPNPQCTEQEQGCEEKPEREEDLPQDVLSDLAGYAIENEEAVITGIRAIDVILGLGRIPAGFYTVVQHSGLEWRTKNKRLPVKNDIAEWSGPIPIPPDTSTTIRLGIYASFEFQPMLGNGELLRDLTVTVQELLDHSANGLPFTFPVADGDIVLPCSSLLVTIQRWRNKSSDPSASRVLNSHCSTTECLGELENATNEGHIALSRYQKHREKRDLQCSIKQFQYALTICSPDHPCRAAAQSNLAMAKFMQCEVGDSDVSLDLPLALYREALALRPGGHVDRPSTLFHLARVHFARFEKWREEVDAAQGEALLREVMEVSPADNHEHQAAISILQSRAGRRIGSVQAEIQSSVEPESPSALTDDNTHILGVELSERYDQSGDLDDLQRAISLLDTFIKSPVPRDRRYTVALADFGGALLRRFRRLGELGDLEEAISRISAAVDLIPNRDPDNARHLNNLGNAFLIRFERFGEPPDLERAISSQENAVNLIPNDHPDRASYLNDLGCAFLIRFKRLGDFGDLERGISSIGDAVELTSDSHPGKPDYLNNLGSFFLARFERIGDSDDLEQAIVRGENAVVLTPDSHPDMPGYMNNLGNSLVTRFHCFGEVSDLEQGISRQEDAVSLTPDGCPDKPGYLNDLSYSFIFCFDHFGKLSDLERAISGFGEAVNLTPDDHPDKADYLNNLGNTFLNRFERLGELDDLEQAISNQESAVNLIPDDHPHKAGYLNNLGNSSFTRFHLLGMLSDLEQAILWQGDAVSLTPDDHPDKLDYTSNLGLSLLSRFERLGEVCDLESAIARLGDAVKLTPDGHPQKSGRLNKLGNSFLTRFNSLGELVDLDLGISKISEAIDLTPDGHPDIPRHLNSLGRSFRARFERLGELSDIEKAISRHENAVELISDSHPEKAAFLDALGNSYRARFGRLGELSDLEKAISKQENAVNLIPDDHSHKACYLNNLALSFFSRFTRLGVLGDVEQAISWQEAAVDLTPNGHPDKPDYLNNLGMSLLARFQRIGELSDLEHAIFSLRDAVELTPDGHPHKPCCLNNLGYFFLTRFRHLGEPSDLEQAISRQGVAVNLTPDGHAHQPSHLNDLGTSLFTRFERYGELGDLEQAISRFSDVVSLTPDDHPDKSRHLNNLGLSFLTRFERLGEPSDLEHATSKFRVAVDLTPDGHSDKPGRMNNLGNSFLTRFELFGELGDLEQGMSTFKDAIGLTPDGHPDKPSYLNNLGNSCRARFERLGEFSDLEQAISRFCEAVYLTPDGHPDKPPRLNNLGNCFRARFERFGELSDIEQAISRQRDAVDLTPEGHPHKPDCLNNLGLSFLARFYCLGELGDIEEAISLYSHAASDSTGPATARFQASLQWISCARTAGHHSLLHAYFFAVGLLPQLAWIGLSLSHRYRELMRGADVVREAAAVALGLGHPETAVEWLEQGRSIVWGELFQLRSSYDELSAVHPGRARRLRELSAALEHAGATREKLLSSSSELTQGAEHRAPPQSLEQAVNRHRTLAIERDRLLREIRGLSGFERFLLHKEFSQLRASAHSGPIVFLNAAEHRCDALIVLTEVENVIHIPLLKFNLERIAGLQSSVKNLVRHTRGEREGQSVPQGHPGQWEPILASLWKCVAKPVLDSLAFMTPGKQLRIFWCPTGPFSFLPIHAAGFYHTQYSQPGHKIFDFVVSSYVPTLSTLAPSPEFSPNAAPSADLRFLAVPQPPSDGLSQLSGVKTELVYIKTVLENSPARITLLESSVGTLEEVLALVKEADWVHFACHGIQDTKSPTDSGLCLADERRLKLSDIIALSRPRGGLAFLSACQTATGDRNLSDEAIHIAAGMLFAGYGGVVGTMWSISDRLAPGVARDVYEQLFRDRARPDYREAARALQDAVGRLRDGGVSFGEWLPFIHVGL